VSSRLMQGMCAIERNGAVLVGDLCDYDLRGIFLFDYRNISVGAGEEKGSVGVIWCCIVAICLQSIIYFDNRCPTIIIQLHIFIDIPLLYSTLITLRSSSGLFASK
jgi:hypothetical protein